MAQNPDADSTQKNCPNCDNYKEAMCVTLELLMYAIDPIRTADDMNGLRITVAKMFNEMNQSIQSRPFHIGDIHTTGS